jgi:tetratricopeptide (TPR) repeat protein
MSALRNAVLAALLVTGCGGASASDHLKKAEEAMAAGDYAGAASEASQGLSSEPDEATRWRLELAALEAQARAGDATAAKATLERLAGDASSRVQASHYVSTADQLKAAGQGKTAIEVLDLGLARFPGDAALTKAIEQAKAGGGADELEALRSLGYLGD